MATAKRAVTSIGVLLFAAATAITASPAHAEGPGLTGTTTYAGHTITWSTSGASAPTGDMVGKYDGVVTAGTKVTFSGSATFAIGAGAVTNLSQGASLSGTAGKSFSQRVGEGTYTMPFSLTTTAPSGAGSLYASLSSRNCNDWGVCGGPSMSLSLAVVDGPAPPVTPPKGQKSMIAAAYKCLKGYLIQAKGHRFYKWSSRGSQDIYRAKLAGLVINVDPGALRSSANAQYLDGVITVRRDPRSIPPGECLDFGKTLWEEVSHAIEDEHGDVGFGQSEDRREARVDYMLEMDEAWAILSRLEESASKGAPAAKLQRLWKLYASTVRTATNKAIGRGYQPDPVELRTWFGWNQRATAIKRNYATGKFLPGPQGKQLRKALR